jgi:alkaline phosphatase D
VAVVGGGIAAASRYKGNCFFDSGIVRRTPLGTLGNLPLQEEKLFRTIRDSRATGVVLISGDRVLGALYRKDGLLDYPVYELTTSALNLPWKTLSGKDESPETATGQIGPLFPRPNYGELRIDWKARTLTMDLKDEKGTVVRDQKIPFNSLKSR